MIPLLEQLAFLELRLDRKPDAYQLLATLHLLTFLKYDSNRLQELPLCQIRFRLVEMTKAWFRSQEKIQ
jgi:hypothetical protein